VYPGFHAATQPDKPAVVMGRSGETITYRELDQRSARLAQLLYARGLRPGDKIALLAENHPRYYEVYWAAIRSGLYITAVSWRLAPDEAAYIVNDCGATAFITTAQQAATAAPMLGLIPGCPLRLMMDGASAGFESYEDAVQDYPAEPLAEQPRGEVMLYTSGTTGRPKGVKRPLSGRRIDDPGVMGVSTLERMMLGMDETSVYLCPAPLYHSAGLQWSIGAHELGGTVVLMEKFDAEEMLHLFERERVTHTQVVPTMLVRLLKLPEQTRRSYDVSSLTCVVHAAAPCPAEVKRQMIDWLGPIVSEYYAATEGCGLTFISAAEWLEHPGSVGRPIIGIPRICGDPTWSTFGDIGYLDSGGYLYLTDRLAFTIISGGVNIYPAEIESCLIMHPKVADVAVFGLPDPEMGEYVHAVVQPAAAATGKLYKRQLREEYLAAQA
jgi:acyl-CoA synthetase (AMP-forming)/AMP-acid ligase II